MKKVCTKCIEEKNLSDFRKDKSKSDGRQTYCTICARKNHKQAYGERYVELARAKTKERYQKHSQLLQEYKSKCSCLMCGEKEPACLEFHHTDPSKKDFGIGTARNRRWEAILEEISKCVPLCSNCHRKVHAGVLILPS